MHLDEEITNRLKKQLDNGIEPLTLNFGLSSNERAEILNDDYMLLLSIIADQSVNSSIAWHMALKLRERLNCEKLTPQYLLEHSESVRNSIKNKPSLHRYPDRMTDYFLSFSQLLVDHFDGEASKLLDSNDFEKLTKRLIAVKGISRKKAGLTCLILEIDKARHINGLRESYALMDAHVRRFLDDNLNLEHSISEKEATDVFREIYPENPALVSTLIWNLDRETK